MSHLTNFSPFTAKSEQNNLRRLAFVIAAESLRKSFGTPHALAAWPHGSDWEFRHLDGASSTCCHYWIKAVCYLSLLACLLHPMASGDGGYLWDLQAFCRFSCLVCSSFAYKSKVGWLDKASHGPTGAEAVSWPRKFNLNSHTSFRISSAGSEFTLNDRKLLGVSTHASPHDCAL